MPAMIMMQGMYLKDATFRDAVMATEWTPSIKKGFVFDTQHEANQMHTAMKKFDVKLYDARVVEP